MVIMWYGNTGRFVSSKTDYFSHIGFQLVHNVYHDSSCTHYDTINAGLWFSQFY